MLYPLKFKPILKDKIWGGTRLHTLYGKSASDGNVGESWELTGFQDDQSIVANGNLAGTTLRNLIEQYKSDLLGVSVYEKYGAEFPLLIKFIDASDDLSVQVHPNDKVAAERHSTFGKTEMWYVLEAEEDAILTIGFEQIYSIADYTQAINNDRVEELLHQVKVKKGDVFFIPPGVIHAIGKGIVIAEIQQSSDITYRIYDYNRVDQHGELRELHTQQALDVIDFKAVKGASIAYDVKINQATDLVKCPYFTTHIWCCEHPTTIDYSSVDSFVVYMCVEGAMNIKVQSIDYTIRKGETLLIPACVNEVVVEPDQVVKFLEVFIA